MHFLFISLVSLLSYGTGITTVQLWVGRKANLPVHPFELFISLFVVCWPLAYRARYFFFPHLGLCVPLMLCVGAMIGCVLLLVKKRLKAGTGEFDSESENPETLSLWTKWLNYSRAGVDYEFRLLLLACYLFIIGPFALLFRIRTAGPERNKKGSTWVTSSRDSSIGSAGRPF